MSSESRLMKWENVGTETFQPRPQADVTSIWMTVIKMTYYKQELCTTITRISQDIILNNCHFPSARWTACLLDVTQVYEPKENISNIFHTHN